VFAVAFAVLAAGAIVLTLNVLLLVRPSSPLFSLILYLATAPILPYQLIPEYLTLQYLVMVVMVWYRVGT
jgi:hypothetical protein